MTGVDWALAAGIVICLVATGLALRRLTVLERRLRHRSAPAAGPALPTSIQNVGLVLYQAYHDVGGDHSFALALLDATGAGVVLNSLYHRDRCRIYAKPVVAWQPSITPTDEELEAISRARSREQAAADGGRGRDGP